MNFDYLLTVYRLLTLQILNLGHLVLSRFVFEFSTQLCQYILINASVSR